MWVLAQSFSLVLCIAKLAGPHHAAGCTELARGHASSQLCIAFHHCQDGTQCGAGRCHARGGCVTIRAAALFEVCYFCIVKHKEMGYSIAAASCMLQPISPFFAKQ